MAGKANYENSVSASDWQSGPIYFIHGKLALVYGIHYLVWCPKVWLLLVQYNDQMETFRTYMKFINIHRTGEFSRLGHYRGRWSWVTDVLPSSATAVAQSGKHRPNLVNSTVDYFGRMDKKIKGKKLIATALVVNFIGTFVMENMEYVSPKISSLIGKNLTL